MIPDKAAAVDVLIQGKILHSDGEKLEILITVSDSSNRQWFSKPYQAIASRYAYDPKRQQEFDAFQTIYNQVANDMLNYRQTLTDPHSRKFVKLANSNSQCLHLKPLLTTLVSYWKINRLPAENDPMIQRIRSIRERDYLFIDTMQQHYNTFSRYETSLALASTKLQ